MKLGTSNLMYKLATSASARMGCVQGQVTSLKLYRIDIATMEDYLKIIYDQSNGTINNDLYGHFYCLKRFCVP